MFVYALTIFTGAFLLFEVQPLMGKYILPWFGGAPAVWTTCMLFFQLLLLGGYAYAHGSARGLKPRAQAILHLVLLAAALALLPIIPADSWKPTDSADPTLRILGLLAVSLGLPYFVLSATGPLMQHWFSRTHPGVSPYRLYALSNVGSLLALVSYPVYFEMHFSRKMQTTLWGWGLVLYAAACVACAMKLWQAKGGGGQAAESGKPESGPEPSVFDRCLWLLLPACASVLLLATTNKMCQEVAVIPFLWVLPLALYLLSFIICFDNPRWYRRSVFIPALMASWGVCWLFFNGASAPVNLQLGVYSAGLFICCMVCHGELYRLRPDPRHLTGYYLMIAAGGALGGLFVTIIAPLIFHDYFELQWGLVLCGALLLIMVCRPNQVPEKPKFWRYTAGVLIMGLAAFGIMLWQQAFPADGSKVYKTRNFYGVLTVTSQGGDGPDQYFVLHHGYTTHGMQFVDPARAAWPTTYYVEKSGVGLAMNALPAGHRRIGLVGLGAGTLAAYAQAGDDFHFYEINPDVQRLAGSRFTYLTNCPGKVEVTLGDARLSLEREPPQNFDLLVLDAFNSDAVPVHLLTEEAFTIYERHLKTNGIIAAHISNRNLNLEPVMYNLARRFNYRAATIDYDPHSDQWWQMRSIWVLLSRSGEFIDSAALRLAARPPRTNSVSIPLWTDDFSSLFQILHPEPRPQINPGFSAAQDQAAGKLYQQGDYAGAIAQYRSALRTQPDLPDLLNNLAWLLATGPEASLRNGPEAVQLSETACRLTQYHSTILVGTLAAAYAEAGRFDEAIATAQKACAMASEAGNQDLLKRNQELLELYRRHQPYHEPVEKLVPAAP